MKRFISVFMLLMIISAVTPAITPAVYAGASADVIRDRDNYTAILYDNTNGLPTSEANTIVSTSDGFLWIGSYSGLIRYDGNIFERIDSTTGIASVVCLHVDSQDRLWIGTNDSGLFLMDKGNLQSWTDEDGLGSDKINCIEEDGNGNIYVGTISGITMITPDMELHFLDEPIISTVYMEMMEQGPDGLLYCLSNEDDYFTLKDGELVDYIGHTETSVQDITCLLPDPYDPGMLYIGTGVSDLYHGSLNQGQDSMESVDISPLSSVIYLQQIENQIWICARNGIGVIDEDGFHYLENVPLNDSVSHVITDYEGNLWFTSTRQGVMKIVRNQFADIFSRFGMPRAVVNSTCMSEGNLFVGTDTGLIIIDDQGPLTEFPLTEVKMASGEILESSDLLSLLEGSRIRSVIRDSSGRLWISTWRGVGLLRYDSGKVLIFNENSGLLSDHIRTVCETSDGKMLVVCTGGICVIDGDQVIDVYNEENGILNPENLCICIAPNGDILLGSNGVGIYVIHDGQASLIDKHDGLSSGIVMSIKYDAARDIFWIVTSNSISYMTSDYQVTTVKGFPYSNNFNLYINSTDDMWILSSNGIYIIPVEEMIENDTPEPVHYGIANGLPCAATSNSYNELTPEGDLYISGNATVVQINIETPLENITGLKQTVAFIEADGVRMYADESGGYTIDPGVKKLTVYGYVFNYSLTDPQVSYKLEGFDQESTTIFRSELDPVIYTNLPGGNYQFVMELKDSLGRGGNTLSVSIVKEKNLLEQTWFMVIINLAAAVMAVLLILWYYRRKINKMEEKHKEEAERERINNELSLAARIQADMLPNTFPAFPDRNEFDVAALMEPAREVGGDFYNYFLLDDDHLIMFIADVSGKGIPASLFMMMSNIIFSMNALMGMTPGEILTEANTAICDHNQEEMFVTVWLGILEISTGRLTAANAGHEYPILKKKDGRFELLKDKHGFVIGGVDGVKYIEYEIMLEPGAKLFLYTDGVPEATNRDKKLFGTDRMLEALNTALNDSPEKILSVVHKAVDDFVKEEDQFDDLTMLCLEYRDHVKNGKES